MTTAEFIKKRRKELKLSQDDLAELIGVNRSTISRYENGQVEPDSAQILNALINALQCTVSELMQWEPTEWELFASDKTQELRWNISEELNKMNEDELELAYRLIKSIKK